MRKLLLLLFAAAALLGVASVVLPGSFEVSRSVVIAAPSSTIHGYVGDLKSWSAWVAWLQRAPALDLKQAVGRATRQAGATLRWHGEDGGTSALSVTFSDPDKGLWYDRLDEGRRPSKGAILYAPVEAGTRVTWLQRGDLGRSPLARLRGLFSERRRGPEVEASLARLKQLLEGG